MRYSTIFYTISILCFVFSCEASNHWFCAKIESNTEEYNEFYCKATSENESNCINLDVQLIEQILPGDTLKVTELKVRKCEVKYVSALLKIYQSLLSLDISHSEYHQNDLNSIELAHNRLQKFNASHNNFETFGLREQFYLTPRLTEIDFSFNEIIILLPLRFARQLTTIHLQHNKIGHLSQGFWSPFMQLTNLEYIDLSSNSIVAVENTLKFNRNFTILHIEDNPLKLIDFGIIDQRVQMYTSWKEITEIDIHLKEVREVEIIRINENEGIFYTSTGTAELHCRERSFESVEIVTIESNQIKNINDLFGCFGSAVRAINIAGNPIKHLNGAPFRRFTKLESLDLSDTSLVELDLIAFDQLRTLIWLYISNNKLKNLQNPSALSYLRNLKYFDASNNEIDNIPEALEHMNLAIEKLQLFDNPIGMLKKSTFQRFHKLSYLYLRNTSLIISDFNPFESIKMLMVLDVSDNNLEKVNFKVLESTEKREMFTSLPHLMKLNLARTNLSRFDGIDGSHFLHLLNVSDNKLKEVNLSLILNNNSLSNSLNTLDLSGNDLTEIDLEYLNSTHFRQLRHIYISYNQFPCKFLTKFVSYIAKEMPELKIIDNPWTQKHGKKCDTETPDLDKPTEPTTDKIEPNSDEPLTNQLYWIIIIATILVINSVTYFTFRQLTNENSCVRKWKKRLQIQRSNRELNREEEIKTNNTSFAEDQTCNEHIYEEINYGKCEASYNNSFYGVKSIDNDHDGINPVEKSVYNRNSFYGIES